MFQKELSSGLQQRLSQSGGNGNLPACTAQHKEGGDHHQGSDQDTKSWGKPLEYLNVCHKPFRCFPKHTVLNLQGISCAGIRCGGIDLSEPQIFHCAFKPV